MKFCGNCGAQLEDSAKFCPFCGNACDPATQQTSSQATSAAEPVVPVSAPKMVTSIPTIQTQTAYNVPPKTNSMAVAGFVLGILSLFSWICCLGTLTSILAIVFSAVGLSKIKQTGEQGRGFAIAGLVLGILGMVSYILYLVLAFIFNTAFSFSDLYTI